MPECSFCGCTDGTHADGCYGGWTRGNAPPTYDDLAAWNNDLRLEVQSLRRQLAECQAAASPALIEEYARACHYAGASGIAIVDWPHWLRRRGVRAEYVSGTDIARTADAEDYPELDHD